MSEAEVNIYIVLTVILFIWGSVLIIKNLIRRGKSKRLRNEDGSYIEIQAEQND